MTKPLKRQIEIEDYGAELADAIIKLAHVANTTPLTNRAIAVLLHDYDKNIPMSHCVRIIEILPKLSEYYIK